MARPSRVAQQGDVNDTQRPRDEADGVDGFWLGGAWLGGAWLGARMEAAAGSGIRLVVRKVW